MKATFLLLIIIGGISSSSASVFDSVWNFFGIEKCSINKSVMQLGYLERAFSIKYIVGPNCDESGVIAQHIAVKEASNAIYSKFSFDRTLRLKLMLILHS